MRNFAMSKFKPIITKNEKENHLVTGDSTHYRHFVC